MAIEDRIRSLDLSLLNQVESQTTEDDRSSLLALHAAIADQLGTFRYLEIGSHLGGSLQCFLVDPRCVAVTSIDPRPESQPDHRGKRFFYPNNSTPRMIELLGRIPGANLGKLITFDLSTSELDPTQLTPPDLCLIDGEHTNLAVEQDAAFCREVMRGDGIIVFHDRSVIEAAIHAFLSSLSKPYRAYPLTTEFFVVELGQASVLENALVRSRLERPRAAWLTMNRLGSPRLLLNDAVRKAPAVQSRILRRALFWRARGLSGPGASTSPATPYDERFFAAQRLGSSRSAAVVVPIVQELVQARSVVDVGCGTGTWLDAFREAGLQDLAGIDGGYVRAMAVRSLPDKWFSAADLMTPLDVSRRFDLAVCLEVAEHLPRHRSAGLVADLTRLAPVVLFSAAIPYQGGSNHVSEAWADSWSALFQGHGYVRRDVLRHRLWERDDVEPWYAQNAFVYVSSAALVRLPRLRDAPESHYPLRCVHPRLFAARVEMLEAMRQRSVGSWARPARLRFFTRTDSS